MWLNLTHALRHLRRRPALTAVGVLSLALGIGCALACASVVNTVLFRAFPYRDAGRLVSCGEQHEARRRPHADVDSQLQGFQGCRGELRRPRRVRRQRREPRRRGAIQRALAYNVTAGLLDATHTAPMLGRLFTPDEEASGAPDVAVISYGLWQRRFGGDPRILGQVIRVTGVPHAIVGVMPRGFLLPPVFSIRLVNLDIVIKEADLWLPLKLDDAAAARRADAPRARPAERRPLDRAGARRSVDDRPAPRGRLSRGRSGSGFLGRAARRAGADQRPHAAVPAAVRRRAGARHRGDRCRPPSARGCVDDDRRDGGAIGARRDDVAAGVAQGTLSVVWCALATVGALVVAAASRSPVAAYTKANVPRSAKCGSTVRCRLALAVGAGLALATACCRSLCQTGRHRRDRRRARRRRPACRDGAGVRRRAARGRDRRAVDRRAAVPQRRRARRASIPDSSPRASSVFEVMLPDAATDRRHGGSRSIGVCWRTWTAMPGTLRRSAAVDYVPLGDSTSIVNFTIEHRVAADAMAKPRAALRAVSALVLRRPVDSGDRRPHVRLAATRTASSDAMVNEAFARRYRGGRRLIGRHIKRGERDVDVAMADDRRRRRSVRGAGLGLEPQPEVFVPSCAAAARRRCSLIVKSSLPHERAGAARRAAQSTTSMPTSRRRDADDRHRRARHRPAAVLRATVRRARGCGVRAEPRRHLRRGGARRVGAVERDRDPKLSWRAAARSRRADPARDGGARSCRRSCSARWARGSCSGRVAAFVYGVESTDWIVIARERAGAVGARVRVGVRGGPARARDPADGPLEARRGSAGMTSAVAAQGRTKTRRHTKNLCTKKKTFVRLRALRVFVVTVNVQLCWRARRGWSTGTSCCCRRRSW